MLNPNGEIPVSTGMTLRTLIFAKTLHSELLEPIFKLQAAAQQGGLEFRFAKPPWPPQSQHK